MANRNYESYKFPSLNDLDKAIKLGFGSLDNVACDTKKGLLLIFYPTGSLNFDTLARKAILSNNGIPAEELYEFPTLADMSKAIKNAFKTTQHKAYKIITKRTLVFYPTCDHNFDDSVRNALKNNKGIFTSNHPM